MGSAYPGMLASFPELKRPYKYFDEAPIVNGGYDERTPFITKTGIFRTRGKRVKISNENWVTVNTYSLWSIEELLDGKFILLDGVVFRIMQNADWKKQAGFFVYELEERIGNSTLQQFAPVANLGSDQL